MSAIDRWRDRWADLHPLWRTLVAAAVVAGIGFAAGPPAVEIYRDWRTSRQHAAALEAADAGNHAAAIVGSLAVLRADPSRQELLPVLFRASDALGDPRRVRFARQMLQSSAKHRAADRMRAWRAVCESSPAGPVFALWEDLPEEERKNPEFATAFIDRMLADGMIIETADLLEEQGRPLPPPLNERLMRLLLATANDGSYLIFQENLIARLKARAEGVEMLLPLLDEIPQEVLSPGVFGALADWPVTDAAAGLRLARCEMAAHPERSDAVFEKTLADWGGKDPQVTARWCLQVGRPAAARELLAAGDPAEDAGTFALLCRVHEATGDFAAWGALLEDPPAGVFLPAVICDRAHVATLAGERSGRSRIEDAALEAAAGSLAEDALIRLARHADSRGMDAFATRVWVEAIRRGTGPLPLGSRLKPVFEELAAANKELDLLDVLTVYRHLEPTNPAFIVQHGYLSCLTGRSTPAILAADLEPLHARMPDFLPVRGVLALARLLDDRPQEALALTDGQNFSRPGSRPSHRAIRGIALARTGRQDEAAELLTSIEWQELLPSERRVLRGLADSAVAGINIPR